MFFDILRGFFLFTFGAIWLVEIIGPLWHQYAQNLGLFGDAIRYRH